MTQNRVILNGRKTPTSQDERKRHSLFRLYLTKIATIVPKRGAISVAWTWYEKSHTDQNTVLQIMSQTVPHVRLKHHQHFYLLLFIFFYLSIHILYLLHAL